MQVLGQTHSGRDCFRELLRGEFLANLSAYLDSLRDDGESQGAAGQFTIDPFKSQKKLQAFRMTRPEHCILPIVSGARLGGATVIDVTGDLGNLNIRFDGRIWTYHDFPELLSAGTPTAREFQTGLSAAQALEADQIVFLSRSGSLLSMLTIKDGTPSSSHREVEPSDEEFNWFEVQGGSVQAHTPIYQMLLERCCYCPQVAWKGRRLLRRSPPSTAARLELKDPGFEQPSVVASAWTSVCVSDAGCSGHIWSSDDSVNQFSFIIDGIAYHKEIKLGHYTGLHGVISAPGLQLDISRENVVENKAFQSLLQLLKGYLDEKLMPKVKREYRLMMPLQRKTADRFLKQWVK